MENKTTNTQDKLVTDNIRLVCYHFGKLRYNEFKSSHGDDFISEGLIGLVKAAKTYDPDKGAKFATYATRCINNQFYMYIRHLRKKEGGTVPMSALIGEDSQLTLADTEIMADYSSTQEIDSIMRDDEVKIFLNTRQGLDKKIFGLMSKGYSQKETAKFISISQSYVSRRFRNLKEAFRKFRERSEQNAV